MIASKNSKESKARNSIADFYHSNAWAKCRRDYANLRGNLCERCLKKRMIVPGVEVHHKQRLTPDNVSDPSIALNFDNLELLCEDCHTEEHRKIRWRSDPEGRIRF